jgi:hypothetical protein
VTILNQKSAEKVDRPKAKGKYMQATDIAKAEKAYDL